NSHTGCNGRTLPRNRPWRMRQEYHILPGAAGERAAARRRLLAGRRARLDWNLLRRRGTLESRQAIVTMSLNSNRRGNERQDDVDVSVELSLPVGRRARERHRQAFVIEQGSECRRATMAGVCRRVYELIHERTYHDRQMCSITMLITHADMSLISQGFMGISSKINTARSPWASHAVASRIRIRAKCADSAVFSLTSDCRDSDNPMHRLVSPPT
ncbi:MAG: hypothetical protein WD845_14885, partial [Pirellulales bacterium]